MITSMAKQNQQRKRRSRYCFRSAPMNPVVFQGAGLDSPIYMRARKDTAISKNNIENSSNLITSF